jgi:signal transduction histidine kinase
VAASGPDRRGRGLARRLRLPRRTVRLRLALLYGSLFFVSGAALLGITYVGFARTHGGYTQTAVPFPLGGSESRASPAQGSPAPGAQVVFDSGQHGADVRVLAIVSVIALVVMAALSIGLGWLVAGRLLRPLSTITSAAREISATDLHRRLALDGPDDEFKELGDTFDGLLARLDASFRSQRQFVANASHELRTPLARLKTLAQVALADPRASVESLRAAHERVLASEQQLEDLILALLRLASSERGLDQLEPVDLAVIAGQLLAGRRGEIEGRGLQLQATLEPARADGNPQLVERLAANLIDNAIRHNTSGGSVEVTTATRAGHAVLSVANDGPIISPPELEQLQQPFRRLAVDRTSQGNGHGLGLSIVHAIADAHGAATSIQAKDDGGLRISVSFPITPAHTDPAVTARPGAADDRTSPADE